MVASVSARPEWVSFSLSTDQTSHRLLVAFGMGLLAALSTAPLHLSYVLIVCFSAIVLLIDDAKRFGKSYTDVFLVGWFFGFGYFLLGMSWLLSPFSLESEENAYLGVVALITMASGLSVFAGLALIGARIFWFDGWTRILILGIAWACAEWIRGHIFGGLPWNLIAYSWGNHAAMIQLAAYVGPYGLGMIYVCICALPALALSAKRLREGCGRLEPRDIQIYAVCVLGFLVILSIGQIRIWWFVPPEKGVVTVRVVQPNTRRADKFTPERHAAVFRNLMSLSTETGLDKVDLVVWPEAATAGGIQSDINIQSADLQPILQYADLITGTPRAQFDKSDGQLKIYNSAVIFRNDNNDHYYYDKVRLVPFGEVVPLPELASKLGIVPLTREKAVLTPGEGRKTYQLTKQFRVGVLICYDAVFPGAAIAAGGRPDLLIVISDDSWLGPSWGPSQHFISHRFRALEEGLPLVRSSDHGRSGAIDALGQIVLTSEIADVGIIDFQLSLAGVRTTYAVFGNWAFGAIVLLAGLLAALQQPVGVTLRRRSRIR